VVGCSGAHISAAGIGLEYPPIRVDRARADDSDSRLKVKTTGLFRIAPAGSRSLFALAALTLHRDRRDNHDGRDNGEASAASKNESRNCEGAGGSRYGHRSSGNPATEIIYAPVETAARARLRVCLRRQGRRKNDEG